MESLALLVTILLISAVSGGPIAYAITFLRVHTRRGFLTRRVFVVLFAIWGAVTALQFALANLALFPRLMGVTGIGVSLLALKREFMNQIRRT